MFRKLVSIVTAATLLSSSLAFSLSVNAAAADKGSAVSSEPNIQEKAEDGVILHAFNWSYNSIKENLPQIAAAGYSTVQTSPVTQPKNYGMSSDVANQWWKLYQPVSFSIAQSSWLGTRDELQDLCTEADKYGIKIIVDIVANHMANNVSSSGRDLPDELGPEVQTYEPEIYSNYKTYFHSEKGKADDSMPKMVLGHVSACPDLNTSNSTIQNKILALLKDCIDCGVDGFRFDAAKHIETEKDGTYGSQFWINTLDKAKTYYSSKNNGKELFAYGEILNGIGSRSVSGYTDHMRVTENKSSDNVLAGVNNSAPSQASSARYQLTGDASKAVLWAESHDTFMGESGSGGLRNTSSITDDMIAKAWAIVASRAKATALYFARPGSSLMGEAAGDLAYKSTVVSEINKFHNAFANVSSEKIGTSGKLVYVARGNSGVVISNLGGNAGSVSISGTGLAAGSYVDTVTGNTFTVSGDTLSGNIGSTGVAVVYKSTSTPKVTASVESGSFSEDTMTVKLSLENAVSGTYALDDSTPAEFTGSPTIRIGSDYKVGETITLNLTAKDASGNTSTATYFYKKKAPTSSGVYVFLSKSTVGSWKNVNCYIYDEDTNSAYTYVVAGWPGVAMSEDGDYYYVEIPARCLAQKKNTSITEDSDFDLAHSQNTYIIFNGTRNSITTQFPPANAVAAMKIKLGGVSHVLDDMSYSGGKAAGWKTTTMTPKKEVVQATDVTRSGQATEATEATRFVQKGIYGDVDKDGKITVQDVSAIQRDLAEFEPRISGISKTLADVDKDNQVTVKDVTFIQVYLAEFKSNYAHTGEPYGEYEPYDPSGKKFTVTSDSNFFPKSTKKLSEETDKFTVSYFIKSSKDLLNADWMLTYDGKAVQPVGTDFMPLAKGCSYNTNPESVEYGIACNFTDIHLAPMKTSDGKQVAFASVTFKVLEPKNTTVNLEVKDLTASILNSGETTSKEANETEIVEAGAVKKPNCSYTLVTSIYQGAFNAGYTDSGDPKVDYTPEQPPVPTEPTTPKPAETKTILFTDNQKWGAVYVHYWGGAKDTDWPGVPMTLCDHDDGFGNPQYEIELPTNITGLLFTDGKDKSTKQTVDITYSADIDGWYPTGGKDAQGHYKVNYWPGGEEPEPSEKTINVGLLDSMDSTGFQVHWWDTSGNAGDAELVSTGKTKSMSVGSSYWSGAAQTFNMFTAAIPDTATGFKVHNGSKWYGSDGTTKYSSVYVFDYNKSRLAVYKK